MDLSLDHTLLVIAVILIISDIFFTVDLPTILAYIIISYVVGTNIEVPTVYQILIGLVFWFLLIGFHYSFYKNLLLKFVSKYIAADRYKSKDIDFIDKTFSVIEVEGKLFIEMNDELIKAVSSDITAGDLVQVIRIEGSNAQVTKLER